jgi:hypothetical protein
MSYENPRLELNDSALTSMIKFAGGNPGAISVLTKLVTTIDQIDPESPFGPFMPLILLDNLDIYEEKIWILYKDVCEEDIVDVVVVLRANQLGFISNQTISNVMETRGEVIDIEDLRAKVKSKLPRFNLDFDLAEYQRSIITAQDEREAVNGK